METMNISLCIFILANSLNARDIDPQDALHAAILNDSAHEIQEAIKMGADPNKKMEPPMRESARARSKMTGQPERTQTPLMLALLTKHQNAIQGLLDGGAQPDEDLIKTAVEDGSFNNALLFLSKKPSLSAAGIDILMMRCFVASNGRSPLETSQESTVLHVIQQLINLGYNVDHIWHQGTGGGYVYLNDNVLKLFLKNGADPNFIYIDGALSTTPLLQAIQYTGNNKANISGIRILLDAGARVNQKANPYANTNLSGAVTPLGLVKKAYNWSPDPELIKLLEERGGTL